MLVCAPGATLSAAAAKSASALQSQKDALENERAQIEKKIEQLKNSTDSYQSLLTEYNKKISVLQKQLNLINSQVSAASTSYESVVNKIANLNEEIISLETEIEQTQIKAKEKEKEISVYYDAFKERMKAIYISGSYTSLQVLMSSEDFSTFLIRLELTSGIARKDKAQLDAMNKQIEQLNELNRRLEQDKKEIAQKTKTLSEKKAQLAKEKSALEKMQSEFAAKNGELKSAKNQAEKTISVLQQKTGKYEADLSAYDNEILQTIKAIEQAKKTTAPHTTKPSGGGSSPGTTTTKPSNGSALSLTYPVPGHTSIYCGFYGYANHGGIDFSDGSINGARVVAAAPGEVIIRKDLNYSYGHYVVIYHGQIGGYYYATCYAHMSYINQNIYAGQSVVRGQSIGKVGSTGNSTGPHLHFELRRYNSSLTSYTRIDPTGYLG